MSEHIIKINVYDIGGPTTGPIKSVLLPVLLLIYQFTFVVMDLFFFDFWCLAPLTAIFPQYNGDQF